MKEYLKKVCEFFDIYLDNLQLQKFDLFYKLVIDWNKKVNLTAITEPHDFAVKHFLDCLLLLKAYTLPNNTNFLDVGTGAGFPGIPLKIVRKDIKLTLLDSLRKRINFLEYACAELEIESNCVHARAEDLSRLSEYREKFDIVASRAVAKLNILSEYCVPFLKNDGLFLAMKSQDFQNEIDQAHKCIGLLGGEISDIKQYELPMSNFRSIILIKKVTPTDTKYPRKYNQILKNPL